MIRLVITVDADGIVAKTKAGRTGPEAGSIDGAAGITIGIGDSNRVLIDQGVSGDGHNFVTATGWSGNSGDVGLGGADAGSKGTKINVQLINFELKRFTLFVKVLKTGFDVIASRGKSSWGVLANSVSELIGGRSFFTTGHIEITPVDVVARGGEGLSVYFFLE